MVFAGLCCVEAFLLQKWGKEGGRNVIQDTLERKFVSTRLENENDPKCSSRAAINGSDQMTKYGKVHRVRILCELLYDYFLPKHPI